MSTDQKIIKNKVGLLKLAEMAGGAPFRRYIKLWVPHPSWFSKGAKKHRRRRNASPLSVIVQLHHARLPPSVPPKALPDPLLRLIEGPQVLIQANK